MTPPTTTAAATAAQAPAGPAPGHGVPICRYADLEPERGVAALVDGVQVAVFRLADGSVLAVGHHDPFSGANVIARGLVGSRGDTPTVASPMFKQVFDLRTGVCLDDPAVGLGSYPVQVGDDGVVRVLVASLPATRPGQPAAAGPAPGPGGAP